MNFYRYQRPESICMIPRCDRVQYARGQCFQCYIATMKLVKRGTVIWQELEEAGISRAPIHQKNRRRGAYHPSKNRWIMRNNLPQGIKMYMNTKCPCPYCGAKVGEMHKANCKLIQMLVEESGGPLVPPPVNIIKVIGGHKESNDG